jgi:hypothetical protein
MDVLVKLLIVTAFFSVFVGLPVYFARRGGERVVGLARQVPLLRGFDVKVKSTLRWDVSALGAIESYAVEVRWSSKDREGHETTVVRVAAPWLPDDLGFEVGRAGVQATSAEYPLSSGNPSFDATFAGWTDHPALAPSLLAPEVRAHLHAVQDVPGIKLSANTGRWTPKGWSGVAPPKTFEVSSSRVCRDAATLEAMIAAALAFARSSAHVFSSGLARQARG